ncbi:hypothetical protein ACFQL0_21675 [Haloplanus litoreus]|uniref:hypothetical protein n=1 Tax=Haloplanus litoreus TaxID=767515 RepID=UPI0036164AE6
MPSSARGGGGVEGALRIADREVDGLGLVVVAVVLPDLRPAPGATGGIGEDRLDLVGEGVHSCWVARAVGRLREILEGNLLGSHDSALRSAPIGVCVVGFPTVTAVVFTSGSLHSTFAIRIQGFTAGIRRRSRPSS